MQDGKSKMPVNIGEIGSLFQKYCVLSIFQGNLSFGIQNKIHSGIIRTTSHTNETLAGLLHCVTILKEGTSKRVEGNMWDCWSQTPACHSPIARETERRKRRGIVAFPHKWVNWVPSSLL